MTVNKYSHGNRIYPNVLRLVLTEYDLAENSYGRFISSFFFFLTRDLCPIAESSRSCLDKKELMSCVAFRKLEVLLEIGMDR